MRNAGTGPRKTAQIVTLAAVLAVGVVAGSLLGGPAKARPQDKDWSWLTGTTWIVPPAGLPAVSFDPQTQVLTPIQDQTVYRITGYRDGYFWGPTAVQAGSDPVACRSLIGSVTPQGDLLLLFSETGQNGFTTLLTGWGKMARKGGEWTMLNQTGSVSMAHWAYMVQTRPGEASWESLPSVGIPVDEFLAQCPAGPQPAE